MSLKSENHTIGEDNRKEIPSHPERASFTDHTHGRQLSVDPEDRAMVETDQNRLHRSLQGRHMQMIAM